MKRYLIPMLAALVALAIPLAASARSHSLPKLVGTTGPGFEIEVTKGGKDVKVLKPGTYVLVVHDKSNIHNFHLRGPGVNKMITTVAFVGTKTVTVKLRAGRYTYMCDPHAAAGMKGSFVVR